jgi:hypothetical protein
MPPPSAAHSVDALLRGQAAHTQVRSYVHAQNAGAGRERRILVSFETEMAARRALAAASSAAEPA